MANHYYTENPELAHDLESWSFQEEQWIMVLVC